MPQSTPADSLTLSGVSLCMATYNSAEFIDSVIASILAQTYANFRLIICDDASTDATVAICRQYQRADRRIAVHANSQRLGWVGNVNRALALADGECLMLASHDDQLEPEYLASLVDALKTNPRAAVAFSDMLEHTLEGAELLHVYDSCEGVTSPVERALKVLQPPRGSWWACYRGLVPTSIYREVGGLRKHWRGEYTADLPWVLRLAIAGEFLRVPRVLYQKFRRKGSLSGSWDRTRVNRIAMWCACLRAVAESRLTLTQALPVYQSLCRRIAYQVLFAKR